MRRRERLWVRRRRPGARPRRGGRCRAEHRERELQGTLRGEGGAAHAASHQRRQRPALGAADPSGRRAHDRPGGRGAVRPDDRHAGLAPRRGWGGAGPTPRPRERHDGAPARRLRGARSNGRPGTPDRLARGVRPPRAPAGAPAPVPPAATTITAAAPSPNRYRWQISGPLKVGANAVRFVSEGASAVHELTAVRLPGNGYAAQFVKALEGTGPPPSFVHRTTTQQTALLDRGQSLLTTLTFARPGTYVFFCHLSDRSGGRPHFAEGLLSTVVVR